MSTAAELRDAAIDLVTDATAARAAWSANARAIARRVYSGLQRPITTDDVEPHLPPIPEGWDRRIMTACFPRADWRRVGWAVSTNPQCHARPKAQWVPK